MPAGSGLVGDLVMTVTRSRPVAAVLALLGALIVVLALLRGCTPPAAVRAVAAGDMACSPRDPKYGDGQGSGSDCRAAAVSDVAMELTPDVVLGLGDYQHEVPSAADYAAAYDPTWGRLREVTRPAVGNQELKVHEANTFYDYFGDRAGPRTGYYSYELAGWHVVVLNTNCTEVVGGCGPQSPQVQWLEQDLGSVGTQCVLAYGHHPRWSNGIAGPDESVSTLFARLASSGVDLYLSGHEADYERFPRLDANGDRSAGGVRQFVVGTGGQAVYTPAEGDAPWRTYSRPVASDVLLTEDPGVLGLTLRSDGYSWEFHGLGGGILDSGSDTC
jgi:hypothetical protein